MWEAVVLNAIIRGEVHPDSGEWDAEIVVRALGAIRAERALTTTLEAAAPDKILSSFLRIYHSLRNDALG